MCKCATTWQLVSAEPSRAAGLTTSGHLLVSRRWHSSTAGHLSGAGVLCEAMRRISTRQTSCVSVFCSACKVC